MGHPLLKLNDIPGHNTIREVGNRCYEGLLFLSFNRQYSTDYKLETYLKIARLFLEDEDPVQAEAYINRASILQADSQNKDLQIYYKVDWPFYLY